MKTLTRYVVVRDGSWFFMGTESDARAWYALHQKHDRADRLSIERWEFPVLDDGTHDRPTKTVVVPIGGAE